MLCFDATMCSQLLRTHREAQRRHSRNCRQSCGGANRVSYPPALRQKNVHHLHTVKVCRSEKLLYTHTPHTPAAADGDDFLAEILKPKACSVVSLELIGTFSELFPSFAVVFSKSRVDRQDSVLHFKGSLPSRHDS